MTISTERLARRPQELQVPQHVIDAFEDQYGRLFDLSLDDHAWRNTWRYKHDHVQSMWEGWRDCYLDALASRSGVEGREDNGGWLPIETAPKDGTHILAWVLDGDGDGHAEVVWYDAMAENAATVFKYGPFVWAAGNDRFGSIARDCVTHWQPLSAPPAPSHNEGRE